MRLRTFFLVFFVVCSLMVFGCGNSDVQTVKDWSIPGYETTTVGKVFKSAFDDGNWKAFETDKGEQIVEFNGKISQGLHDTAVSLMLNGKQISELEPYDLDVLHNVAGNVLDANSLKTLKALADVQVDAQKDPISHLRIYAEEFLNTHFWPVSDTATFQFAISAKDKTPQLHYIGCNSWKQFEMSEENILNVIYH